MFIFQPLIMRPNINAHLYFFGNVKIIGLSEKMAGNYFVKDTLLRLFF